MIVKKNGRVAKRRKSDCIDTYHGTMAAGIIKRYAPSTEFCSIKIFFDRNMKSTCTQLVAALEWCYKMNIPIINLSVDTTDPDDFNDIRYIIDKLLNQNQKIIAACKNNGEYTMPAFHEGVFGVKVDAALINDQISNNYVKGEVPLLASGSHNLVLLDGSVIITQITNSYAAPTVTAEVCNLMETSSDLLITPNIIVNTHN